MRVAAVTGVGVGAAAPEVLATTLAPSRPTEPVELELEKVRTARAALLFCLS